MNTALGSIAAAANDITRRTDAAAAAAAGITQSTAGSRIRNASALLADSAPASTAGRDALSIAPNPPAAASLVANRTRTASLASGTTGRGWRVAVGRSVFDRSVDDRSIDDRSIHGQSIRGLNVSRCVTIH